MGLGRAHRLGVGGDFKVIIWRASHKRMRPFFIDYVKEPLYSVSLNLNDVKHENGNQNVKVEKIAVFVKTFDYYHHKFDFGTFFSCLVKLKLTSKFNHDFTRIIALYAVLFEKLYTILR